MCADNGAVRGKAFRSSKQKEGERGGGQSEQREREREGERGKEGGEVTAYPKPQTLEKKLVF